MTKLTKYIRDDILKAAVDHRFGPEYVALDRREGLLATKVYRAVFHADFERMTSLPDGWLYETNSVCVQLGTQHTQLRSEKDIRLPWSKRGDCLAVFDGSHPFAEEYEAILRDRKDLDARRKKAKNAARSVLYSVSTVKQLVKVWPEVTEFVPLDSKPAQLPALPIAELNGLLGLRPQAVA